MHNILFPKAGEPSLKIAIASGHQVRLVSEGKSVIVESVTSITAACLWLVIGMLVVVGGMWVRSL